MNYLTAEWEVLALRKKTSEGLHEELGYLIFQMSARFGQYMMAIKARYIGEPQVVPAWKLLEDIQIMHEQTQRIIDEINRREIP